jgi:biopolymer transport protein ExbD
MGASVGTDTGGKSVDVELNVVPFIDLMSCLTAFLLATAVWSQYSQINIKPKGIGRKTEVTIPEEDKIYASILLTKNEIWAGLTTGDKRQISNDAEGYDWDGLEETLKEFKDLPVFNERGDIEIAADDDVKYQTVITAMDASIIAKFDDIGFVDPNSLSVRFRE